MGRPKHSAMPSLGKPSTGLDRAVVAAVAVLFLLPLLCTCDVATTRPRLATGPTLHGTTYARGGQLSVAARRIEFVTITVDDMALARGWYAKILGGKEINLCHDAGPHCTPDGAVRYSGDAHLRAIFGKELTMGATPPSIGDGGEYEVHSRFLLLGTNGLLQLMQFVALKDGAPFHHAHPTTERGPCWVNNAHMCLWIDEEVDLNPFIAQLESASQQMGAHDVKVNRPVPQQTRYDRDRVPEPLYANKVYDGSAFDGLEWAYFKGPIGEQLEMYKMTNTIKNSVGRAYCERGAVSGAFVQYSPKCSDQRGITQRLTGIFQYGYRTDNLDAAVGFYTEVLGGDVISFPTHGQDIRGDAAHWMILANETIEAYENKDKYHSVEEAERAYGVTNISGLGSSRLDYRFILFDNFVVEALFYTEGLSFGGEPFNPHHWQDASSPALVGSVIASFGSFTNLQGCMQVLQQRALRQGFPHAYFPSPKDIADFAPSHPLSGLSYGYGKGQAGEAIAFVESDGSFKETLVAAILREGAVSTICNETNAWQDGRMDRFCATAQHVPMYGA